jgi:hypothetical protein
MTNKRTGNGKNEIQGSFTAFRMTAKTNNSKSEVRGFLGFARNDGVYWY